MTDYNCNKRCGICCVVCTDIPLTREEVKSKEYHMNKSGVKYKEEELRSGFRLKTMDRFIPELKREYSTCFYFDPIKKECAIYDNRPKVCRDWNCEKGWSNSVEIKAIWEGLKEGKTTDQIKEEVK